MNNPPPPPQQDGSTQPYASPEGQVDAPKKSGWSGCLIGCLVAFGLAVLLCGGVGFYAYSNASTWIISAARQGVSQLLQDSDLPAEEQTAIMDQFDRVTTAYQEGEITLQELGPVMQELVESPLMGAILLKAVESKYIDPSGLDDEEKADGKRTMHRLVRGMVEEKFDKDEIQKITSHFLLETQPNGAPANPNQPQFKQSLTDEELRELLADGKTLADEKEIPDEDYDVKLSELIERVVDEALSKQ